MPKDFCRFYPIIAAVSLLALFAPAALAAREPWTFEITPYIWAMNIDGNATIGGQQVSVDKSFSDLFDAVDIGAAVLLRGEIGRWVVLGQLDYYELSTDELDNPPARGTLDTDVFMGTLAGGYLFGDAHKGRSFGLMLGVRQLSLDNELRLQGIGRFAKDDDLTDPLLIFTSDIRISDRWRFNPMFAYSNGGDAEESYELQPQFQWQISERIGLRIGYRRLHYEIEGDAGNRWDGAFQGFIVGLGGTFGSRGRAGR